MKTPEPLAEILALDGAEFGPAFYDYLTHKKNGGEPLDAIEDEAWLLLSMLLDIELEGLIDLFYQFYSLRDCDIVEAGLKKLGLHDIGRRCQAVYTGGRTDITEEEYRGLIRSETTVLASSTGWQRNFWRRAAKSI